jgi:hypothetical protein
MALIRFIRDWWNRKLTKIGCKIHGHCGVVTIESYFAVIQLKNWRVVGKKNLTTHPYWRFSINGKHKCTACGEVFLGVIVKEEQFHDNHRDA